MAKIKEIKLRLELDPKRPYQETVVQVLYDSRDGWSVDPAKVKRFHIKLPDVVAAALNIAEVRSSTQEAVIKEFREAINTFKNMSKEVHRVICYHVSSPRDWTYTSFRGIQIGMWAAGFVETVSVSGTGDKRYAYELENAPFNFAGDIGFSLNSRGDRYSNQVPWTEENAKFFLWLKIHMEELQSRIGELEKPEALMGAIASGRLLPLMELSAGTAVDSSQST